MKMSRVVWLIACVALSCGNAAGAEAAGGRSSAALGDLVFHYETEDWQIVPGPAGLIATCLQADCRGAVVDIIRHEGEEGCSEAAMMDQALDLFPVKGRAYANTLRAGRFALVLAVQHDGPELGSPEFVQGCVPWQGHEYRFAMRPATVGKQSWIGGALHYLVSQATAPEAKTEILRLSEVEFRVSFETWQILEDRTDDLVRLACRVPTCREAGEVAMLSVHSPAKPCPGPDGDVVVLEGSDTRITTLPAAAQGGLNFTISYVYPGCRSRVPPHFEACAVHAGRSYHLSTDGPFGCRSSSGVIPEQALIDLMKDARAGR